MKRLIFILTFLPLIVAAQDTHLKDQISKEVQIKEVTVYGKRPIKEIGVQQTKFDTVALKENISLSMADVLTFNSLGYAKVMCLEKQP